MRLTHYDFKQLAAVHGASYARDYAIENGTNMATLRRWLVEFGEPYYLQRGPYIKPIARLQGQVNDELVHWSSGNFPEAVKLLIRAQYDLWWMSLGKDRPCLRMSVRDYMAAEMRSQLLQANVGVNYTSFKLLCDMTANYKLPGDKEPRKKREAIGL